MECKVIGETGESILAHYKGCAPFLRKINEFKQEFEESLGGKGYNSFQD